jgi:hypothetical protein
MDLGGASSAFLFGVKLANKIKADPFWGSAMRL